MNKTIMCIGLAVISHVASGMDPYHHNTRRGGGRSEAIYFRGGDIWKEQDYLVTFQKLPTGYDAKKMGKCFFGYGAAGSIMLHCPCGGSGLWYSTEEFESVSRADKQKKIKMIIQEQCEGISEETIMVVLTPVEEEKESNQESQNAKPKIFCIEKSKIEALNK